METDFALKYNHDEFVAGSRLNRIRLHWLPVFSASRRFAGRIKLPFLHLNGAGMEPSIQRVRRYGCGISSPAREGESSNTPWESSDHALGKLYGPGTAQTVLRLAWWFPPLLHAPF